MTDYTNDFRVNGFCIVKNAIDIELVDKANLGVDQFRTRNDDLLINNDLLVEGMLQRVINLHHSITGLQEIFCQAMTAGGDVVDNYGKATLYTSLFFELGSQQPLHRDTPYFYSGTKGGYMGVWVALDDVDENNGALIAVKGSHELPEPNLVELKNRFHPNEDVPSSSPLLFDAYNQELINAAHDCGLSTQVCNVNKGDLIIWNPQTLHGGLPHHDKTRTRRSFVMHITPKNMPMKHMDYFFHRDKPIEAVSNSYQTVGERLMSAGDQIDFRHIKCYSTKELGIF